MRVRPLLVRRWVGPSDQPEGLGGESVLGTGGLQACWPAGVLAHRPATRAPLLVTRLSGGSAMHEERIPILLASLPVPCWPVSLLACLPAGLLAC